jgi:hypothetical protein
MAYCPDDGAALTVATDEYDICYQCPACGVHWLYQEGAYHMVEGGRESCPNCQMAEETVEGDAERPCPPRRP